MKTIATKAKKAQSAPPQASPVIDMLGDMPIQHRTRLLELAIHGLLMYCDGCCPTDEDFDPILWLAQDLTYQVNAMVKREEAAKAAGGPR